MKKYILNLLFLAFLISLNSCSKDAEENIIQPNPDGLVPVSIRVSGITSGATADTRANYAAKSIMATSEGHGLSRASLRPASEAATRGNVNMADGIKYAVFFFDGDDKCVAYKELICGSEGTAPFNLMVGTYTVVALSYNSASLLPATAGSVQSNPLAQTIGELSYSVSPLAEDGGDLLFYKKTGITISSTAENTVSLVFKHLFNKIELAGNYTQLSGATYAYYMDGGTMPFATDGTETSGAMTGLAGTLTSYTSGTFNLGTEALTNTTTGTVDIADNFIAWLPTDGSDITLTLSNATATDDTQLTVPAVTFSGVALEGMGYLLKFGYMSNDSGDPKLLYWATGNLQYRDYDSNRENGTYSFFSTQDGVDPSTDGSSADAVSSQWQWRTLHPGDATTYSNSTSDQWTLDLDPCHAYNSRWRVPTYSEFLVIRDAGRSSFTTYSTTSTHNGYWIGSDLNGSSPAAGKESEYLFLPVTVSDSFGNSWGDYWSSTYDSKNAYPYNLTIVSNNGGSIGVIALDPPTSAFSLRCVSDGVGTPSMTPPQIEEEQTDWTGK
jgi:hypothetical protein